jgi:hypothetical protein
MGRNFLVAAFIPAMAFVVCSYVVFQPMLPDILKYSSDLPFVEKGIVLLLFTTILGFTLYTIGIYVYKAFEGYVFILGKNNGIRRSFLRKHKKLYQKAVLQKKTTERDLEIINRKLQELIDSQTIGQWYNKRLSRLIRKRQNLEETKYRLTYYLDHNYPASLSAVMPTRFGNLLRAAEMYPKRYGIDAVPLWSKLASALPADNSMMEKINEANNQCQFLLNGSLLGVVFSILCLIGASFEGMKWSIDKLGNSNDGNLAIIYLLLMLVSLTIARFFYEASLYNVGQFGEMIRATYDLHRFQLLDAMHIELPLTLKDEKEIWLKVSHFVTGNLDYQPDEYRIDDSMSFTYSHSNKQTTK